MAKGHYYDIILALDVPDNRRRTLQNAEKPWRLSKRLGKVDRVWYNSHS